MKGVLVGRGRATLYLLLALAAWGAQALLGVASGSSSRPRLRLGPGELAASVTLGGFRVALVSALWVELLDRRDAGDAIGVPPIADLLTALEPGLEPVWTETAWVIAVEIPAYLQDERAVWPWRLAGMARLQRGIRVNPQSWRLRYDLGVLAHRFVADSPVLSKRFIRARGLNPRGLSPHRFAEEVFAQAQRLPDHPVRIDWGLLLAALKEGELAQQAGRLAPARRALGVAEATLAHVVRAHPQVLDQALASFRERVEALAVALRQPRRP